MKRLLTLLALGSAVVFPAAASAATPLPFGHACGVKAGVRFCPTTTLDQRIPSFDGTPIDADVTLPATGDGPFPLIVLLHGYGGSKTDLQSTKTGGTYDDVAFASQGYAVVTVSERGFGQSCGAASSRTPDCEKAGWIHLDDLRYEARDTQLLMGDLVDEGIADPAALGVSGGSYGGGLSLELAFLKNRVVMPNGSYAPWTSPKGTPLSIAAAAPLVPWADLAAALVPNGHWRDDMRYKASVETSPIGVPIKSYINGLYAAGTATGWVAPIGSDPQADLSGWRKLFVDDGEPFGTKALPIEQQMQKYHSALSIPGKPAPLLVANGWTDDLFPAPHALRIYNEVRARAPKAPISLVIGSFGHMRGGKEPAIAARLATERTRFFAFWLKHQGKQLPRGGVTVGLTRCPDGTRGATFKAKSWPLIARKAIVFGDNRTRVVRSDGGDPALGKTFDPLVSNPCTEADASSPAGSAVVDTKIKAPATMLGPTEISAVVAASGHDAQLDGRLWDVEPSGKMLLIDRGDYRLTPGQKGRIRFQLHGNGWQWLRGHTARLELAGSDADYYRASNTKFTVKVSKLNVTLRVH